MAYIGRTPDIGNFEKQILTPDSVTTTFALTYAVGSANSLYVNYGGVPQEPQVAYSVSGGGQQIVFSEAPVTGTTLYIIYYGKQLTTPRAAGQETTKQTFAGDGSTVTFTLTDPPVVPAGIMVFVDGILQREGSGNNYVSSGSTISFTSAPDSSAEIDVYTLVKEKVSIDTVADGSITRTKLAQSAPYWDGAGNVGINVAAPAGVLDMQKDQDAQTLVYLRNASTGTSARTRMIFSGDASAGNLSIGMYNSTNSSAPNQAWVWASGASSPLILGTVGTERVRIDTSGRFFVGTTASTTSSSQSGEVYSTGATGFLFTNATNANYGLSVKNQGTSGTRALINFLEGAGGGTARANISLDGSTNFAITASNATTFTNGGSERMRIDSAGNVSIGAAEVNNVFDQVAAARPLVVQKSDSSTTLNGSAAAITIVNSNTTTSNTAQLNFAAITGASTNQYSSAVISTIFGPRTNAQYPTGIMTFSTSTTLNTAPTEKMRLGADGQLMVGTTAGNSSAGGAHFTGPIVNGVSGLYQQQLSINSGNTIQCLNLGVSYTPLLLQPLGSSIYINTTNSPTGTNGGCGFVPAGAYGVTRLLWSSNNTATVAVMAFDNPNGNVGSIGMSGSSTYYSTSSDYRLKENITPITGALAKVALLKPVNYKWKADGANGEGFIAHELAEVCPHAVIGEKDAVDDEGKIKSQSIDTSFLVATLTAAIQELKAIVDAQAVEIAALKAK